MSDATHTPGPLCVSKHATPEHCPQFGIYPEQADGRDIATVSGPNAERDAALFAASPDLLDATKRLLAQIVETSAYDDARKGEDEGLLNDVAAAWAAVHKAEG